MSVPVQQHHPLASGAFVGREEEILHALQALERGRNLIVSGRYGMGRTALLREVGRRLAGASRLVFCDFSRPPSEACGALTEGLFGRRPRRGSRFLALRREILARGPASRGETVLVLDDVARLTHAQADLLGRLAERFRIAVVVERFLPAADRLRLATALGPAERIVLGRLSPAQARCFFTALSERHGLGLEPERIAGLARASGGYPLRLCELARRETAR